jgi:hypothetical protein
MVPRGLQKSHDEGCHEHDTTKSETKSQPSGWKLKYQDFPTVGWESGCLRAASNVDGSIDIVMGKGWSLKKIAENRVL